TTHVKRPDNVSDIGRQWSEIHNVSIGTQVLHRYEISHIGFIDPDPYKACIHAIGIVLIGHHDLKPRSFSHIHDRAWNVHVTDQITIAPPGVIPFTGYRIDLNASSHAQVDRISGIGDTQDHI